MSDIAERVKKIILEDWPYLSDKVTPGASLIDDLGLDSLDLVVLVMTVEQKFGVEIEDAAMEKLVTVQDVTDCLERRSQMRGQTTWNRSRNV